MFSLTTRTMNPWTAHGIEESTGFLDPIREHRSDDGYMGHKATLDRRDILSAYLRTGIDRRHPSCRDICSWPSCAHELPPEIAQTSLLRDFAGSFSLLATDKLLPTICASSMRSHEFRQIMMRKHVVPWAYTGLKHFTGVLCAYSSELIIVYGLVCYSAPLQSYYYRSIAMQTSDTRSTKHLEYIRKVHGILLFVPLAVTRLT